ncbi:MAG: glycosyltransferase [Colwellia sp.]|nr:glycosyltransferase [Colwellia sp.]
MKKIAHVVSSLNVGGAEKFVKNISAEQIKRGDEVVIISFGKPDDAFQHAIEQSGVKVYNLTGGILYRLTQFISIAMNFSILHIHSPSVIRALLPIFPFLCIKNIIYTIHGEVDPPQKLINFSHKIAIVYLNQIVAVSKSAKTSVSERYGWNSNKVSVIKNGVNITNKSTKTKQSNVIRLGIVSRLIPLKNISLLFLALTKLPENISNQFTIHIFGEGPEKEKLVNNAKLLINENKVTFHGNVINEDDIYNLFDILVMCSNTEGLPMSILEAMGYSLPVISTRVGAIPDVISPNKTGWLYRVKAVDELKQILESIAMSPNKTDEFGQAAKEFIMSNYSISMVYDDYNKVYSY